MGTARRPPSYSRRPETVDHNRERERERERGQIQTISDEMIE